MVIAFSRMDPCVLLNWQYVIIIATRTSLLLQFLTASLKFKVTSLSKKSIGEIVSKRRSKSFKISVLKSWHPMTVIEYFFISLSHTHTHTRTHTNSLTLSLTLSLCLLLSHSLSFYHSHSLFLNISRPLFLPVQVRVQVKSACVCLSMCMCVFNIGISWEDYLNVRNASLAILW